MSGQDFVETPSRQPLEQLAKQLRARSSAVMALAGALGKRSPAKAEKAITKLEALQVDELAPLLEHVRGWLAAEKATRRGRLAADLRDACAAGGLDLMVLSQDPLELRIPPLSALLDVDRNKAELRFADQVLATTEARADLLLDAHARVCKNLESGKWDPAAYLGLLRQAWRRASTPTTEWVELVDVLPELALLIQSRRFRRDPSARNFKPYPKAQFAYDLWRLRRDRVLSAAGWRLSLGPATGGSTRDKGRVLRLEDDRGRGQYHLALRFVREEAP